jgi:hypothetical protein
MPKEQPAGLKDYPDACIKKTGLNSPVGLSNPVCAQKHTRVYRMCSSSPRLRGLAIGKSSDNFRFPTGKIRVLLKPILDSPEQGSLPMPKEIQSIPGLFLSRN